MNNFLEHKDLVGEEVILLGSGPNGQNIARQIRHKNIAAVNSAVLLNDNVSHWIISDLSISMKSWWKQARNYFKGTSFFPYGLLASTHYYSHNQLGDVSKTTVGGAAIKILSLLGAETIYLCGFDFGGTLSYLDPQPRPEEVWSLKKVRFENLARSLPSNVYVISDTKLDLPYKNPEIFFYD